MVWIGVGKIYTQFLRIIFIVIVAREIGPTPYGAFYYVLYFIATFFILSDWGVGGVFMRDFQKKKNSRPFLVGGFWFVIMLGILATGFAFWAKKFITDPIAESLYIVLLCSMILDHIRNIICTIFDAHEKMHKSTIVEVINQTLMVLLSILFFGISFSIISVALAYFLSSLISLIVAYLLLQEVSLLSLPSIKLSTSYFPYFFREGAPLIFHSSLGVLFFSIDRIMIGFLRGVTEVGWYTTAIGIISLMLIIPSIIIKPLIPHLSKKIHTHIPIQKTIKKTLILLMLLGGAVALIGEAIGGSLIFFLFGEKFLSSIPILRILLFSLFFSFPLAFLDTLFFIYEKIWLNFFITLIPLTINIIGNLLLIPSYGMMAAAYMTLISYMGNFFITLFFAKKHLSL